MGDIPHSGIVHVKDLMYREGMEKAYTIQESLNNCLPILSCKMDEGRAFAYLASCVVWQGWV